MQPTPEEIRAKVRSLYQSGVNISQIARQVNLTRPTVYRILDKSGLLSARPDTTVASAAMQHTVQFIPTYEDVDRWIDETWRRAKDGPRALAQKEAELSQARRRIQELELAVKRLQELRDQRVGYRLAVQRGEIQPMTETDLGSESEGHTLGGQGGTGPSYGLPGKAYLSFEGDAGADIPVHILCEVGNYSFQSRPTYHNDHSYHDENSYCPTVNLCWN